jgi:tRNA (guanine37-N1)-methyltransferase
MVFHIITIFPEMVRGYLEYGILSRAVKKDLVSVVVHDLRENALNRYGQIDDRIFGSGKGMLFRPEPLAKMIEGIREKEPDAKVIHLTPQGGAFDNKKAKRISKEKSVILIASRYEGIDERIVESLVNEEISVGDYVLTGGELPALTVVDAATRFIEGSIQEASAYLESFEDGLLEHGHYTRPEEFRGMKVPEILRKGNHKDIGEYRRYGSLKKTYFNRPELLMDHHPALDAGETADPVKALKRMNGQLTDYLKDIEKISKEWIYVRRNSED